MPVLLLIIGGFLLVGLGILIRPFCSRVMWWLRYKLFPYAPAPDPIYKTISLDQQQAIKSAVKISFTGDLILLRDMVERAYIAQDDTFNFDEMFEHVKDYWAEDDLSIAVFEGPVASADNGYSTSCYGDNIPLYLNFPVSFAKAVKKAGIDFVTTANNHLLDQGIEGYMETLDVLDSIHLDHSGSYRTPVEHDQPKILQVKGLKIGVLTYTYGSNYYSDDFFFKEGNEHITSCVMPKKSKFFKACQEKVKEDFKRLKSQHPDIIIVLPHMGEQFLHAPDKDQLAWCELFIEQGADIIFSDHSHAVQPIEWRKNNNGKNVLIAHCPGNFINSYIEHDGDASMIVEAYLSPETGEPFAASCIPLYSYCKQKEGVYQALPIYKGIKVDSLYNSLSVADFKRMGEIHKLITKTALGVRLSIDQLQEHYFTFAEGGYVRNTVPPMEWKQGYSGSKLVQLMQEANKICFVGDSITEGTKNGGYGWYEPLVAMLGVKNVTRWAKGSMTSTYFVNNCEHIAKENADLYVLGIGCNDIRYRDATICAMDSKQFVVNINQFIKTLRNTTPGARIVVISPWLSFDPDPYCHTTKSIKQQLYKQYATALERYCYEQEFLYINPNTYVHKAVRNDHMNRGKYFNDHIHPNAGLGIELLSKACVVSSIN